ncbi:hypothetical protein [Marinimicrobium agarilyticum]|uniref:hypothetical protein n=1 Tax=Marinimicrobium agarilyticum TaxID=306546 RepID=UPI00041E7B1F|nr:hypothetical protein [Marinimicrobium agarilyticum]
MNFTFSSRGPSWANACVGNNGDPGYYEYSKGYSMSAKLILEKVLEDHGVDSEFHIYPACFCIRHSVELRLKHSIEKISKIYKIKSTTISFDYSRSHDIKSIWEFFKEASNKLDDRYKDEISSIENVILDIADIDPTGQTFRYPKNLNSKKHLRETGGLINCLNLFRVFSDLESRLDHLDRLNSYLIDEYGMESFTKNLSRKKIFEIAELLPKKDHWNLDTFSESKKEIAKKYQISNRELSKAIDIIKNHFEMAPCAHIKLEPLGVNEQNIIEILDFWVQLYPDHKKSGFKSYSVTDDAQEVLDRIFDRNQKMKEINETLENSFTKDATAGISALFHFGYSPVFSESYIHEYKSKIREISANKNNGDFIRSEIEHILNKTNFLKNILKSIKFLGFNELARKIILRYDYNQDQERSIGDSDEDVDRWLDDAIVNAGRTSGQG